MIWDDKRWPSFSIKELECKGSGELIVVPAFMDKLQALRDAFGKPIIITSGYRCPEYNNEVSGTGKDGPHTTGRAVDIDVRGLDALQIIFLAKRLEFTGFGVSQKGDHRFIHIDDLTNEMGVTGPRPWIWSY